MEGRRTRLAEIFKDTQAFYTQNRTLAEAVRGSTARTAFYSADDYPRITREPNAPGRITVSKDKTFAAAMRLKAEFPTANVTVLNFASASNPGGGVRSGSSAQEESLCRCSTLYPTLNQPKMWDCYYNPNRAASDPLHTDACIYSPDIVICKTDDDYPTRLPESDFVTVNVLTCAAPNLRSRPNNPFNPGRAEAVRVTREELYALHLRRAKHILHVAAANGTDVLVLGAFGCGAFCNDPSVVSAAYAKALREYAGYFLRVDFAVYCRDREVENYNAFRKAFS